MTDPGRNTPCPCGSERKYKHCCQHAVDDEQRTRLRLRGIEGNLVPRLLTMAANTFGPGYVGTAWDEFLCWPETLADPADSKDFSTTFEPFLVFSYVPDPAADDVPTHWPTTTLAMHYLAHDGVVLEGLPRTFLLQACRSPASFFAVEGVEPGRALSLRDMLTGWRVRVLEQSASRVLTAGDVMFTRVLTCEGTSILIGACPWVLPASWQLTVIEARRRWRPRRAFRRADLEEYDIELRDLYHEIVDAMQHPAPPVICNPDGEPLELWTLTYALSVSAHEAITKLMPLAKLGSQTDLDAEAREPDGTWRAATLRWVRRGNRQHADWKATVLGTLRVDGNRLTVDVNSAHRRIRVEREITRRLQSAAVQQSAEMAPLPDFSQAEGSRTLQSARQRQATELPQVEAELAQQHWVEWLDSRVPALGHRTPRQAARTTLGRERLDALLADYAQQESTGGQTAPDVGALRRALGLDPTT